MLELLLLSRTNKYVMFADMCKAFLMIKLGSLEDGNRFCFFIKEGNKLVCSTYTTIIFGFMIKDEANKYTADNCTDMFLKISMEIIQNRKFYWWVIRSIHKGKQAYRKK